MKPSHIVSLVGLTLTVSALPAVANPFSPSYFEGNWVGEGYTCATGQNWSQEVEIDVTGNTVVARKLEGDPCVPAGNITFRGSVSDRLEIGVPVPVTWTAGNPRRPASVQVVDPIVIEDQNTFVSGGITFTRLNPLPAQFQFEGTWIGEGYTCERGSDLVQRVRIEIVDNALVARKLNGDRCVPAGFVTFQAPLPDQVEPGVQFPVTWTEGTPRRPASRQVVDTLVIEEQNTFSSGPITFTREQ